jgi:hypothetical protein
MSDLGETTNLEKTSLEAHVDLCAMRYRQLDIRLTSLEIKMDAIQRDIVEGQKSLKTTLITSAGTIVASVIGLVVAILIKM